MTELGPAEAVATCERSLRLLFAQVYANRYGSDWLKRFATSERIAEWANRAEREAQTRGCRGVAHLPPGGLDYAEFYELIKIAESDWEPLSSALGKQKEVIPLLWQAERLRNSVAHSRVLLPFERDLLSGIAGLMRNQVTIFMSSQDPSGQYYPRIEYVTDGYGNTARFLPVVNRWATRTSTVLRIGDHISFDCAANDPLGRPLKWAIAKHVTGPLDWILSDDGRVSLRWQVGHDDVSDRFSLTIFVTAADAQYHRHGTLGYDDRAGFTYRVEPPIG